MSCPLFNSKSLYKNGQGFLDIVIFSFYINMLLCPHRHLTKGSTKYSRKRKMGGGCGSSIKMYTLVTRILVFSLSTILKTDFVSLFPLFLYFAHMLKIWCLLFHNKMIKMHNIYPCLLLDSSVHVWRVCGGLRADQGRLLQKEGRSRRRGGNLVNL